MAGEFDIIKRHFTRMRRRSDVLLGVGDDAALLRPSAGFDLVVTVDTSIAGRHFPDDMSAADVGWRALAVNLSDLAAMGADPAWFTLALSLPEADEDWLYAFSRGLFQCADQAGIELVGGDTTRGQLSITIQAMGQLPPGQALRRDGARDGDLVCVTGTLGDAALGLRLVQSGADLQAADAAALVSRLYRPTPRLAAGMALRGRAHACIDISDGFAADLSHILEASGTGATIDADALPASNAFRGLAGDDTLDLQCGGDDYELCVCLAPETLDAVQSRLDCEFTPVGLITAERGLHWRGEGGTIRPAPQGYDHFNVTD